MVVVRIEPINLHGPTAYFTDFDYRIISRVQNIEEYSKKAERKLKALLLLKTNITFAASHLTSLQAYNFFKANPPLLLSGAIVPAFRSDKHEIGELFEHKNLIQKKDIIQFYTDNIQKTVNWDLVDNSGWFRARFLEDINDPYSILNINIGKNYQYILQEIANICQKGVTLDREIIDQIIKYIPLKQREIIQNYRELLYHISGARVINSESVLPQENYIDYDLADIEQKRVKLTEDQILTKLLVETVFDSLENNLISINILDILSFEDIIKIREPLLESDFQNKYDALTKNVIATYSSSFEKVFNLSDLINIRNDLYNTFKEIIEKEIPKFLAKKKSSKTKELLGNSTSLALGILSFIPQIGTLFSLVGFLKDSKALIINVRNNYNSVKTLKNRESYYEYKKNITKYLAVNKLNSNTVFLDFVDNITRIVSEKTKL